MGVFGTKCAARCCPAFIVEARMDRPDVNPTQGFRPPKRQREWTFEEAYWRDNWSARTYANADRGFDYYRPAYRYGFESASRTPHRSWDEAESELRIGWDRYEHRGETAWEHVKEAVRDAWHRVTSG
ncbi:MAG: hypothetical protein ACREBE_17310 [bacterium]